MCAWSLRIGENTEDADWLHLTEDEEVRWTGRPSRFTIAVAVVGGAFLVVAGIALTPGARNVVADTGVPDVLGFAPLVLAVVGTVWAGLAYLDWLRLLYVITDEELYVKYGLVSRDVTQVPLDRIQNTSYEQSILERLLRYGDVHIYTAGSNTEDLTFRNVPRPATVKRILTDSLSDQTRARIEHHGLD